MMQRRVYLDWNAGAPLITEARAAAAAELARGPGNPSSVHAEGRASRAAVEAARRSIARLLGDPPGEVVLTSSGSEANASAVIGHAGTLASGRPPVIALARVEHPSLLEAARRAEVRGAELVWLPVDGHGVIDIDAAADVLGAGAVTLLCLQLANSETGVIQPVARASALAAAAGVAMHCDAVQAAGKVAIDLSALAVGSLAVSAHKLGGLPGAGALLLAPGAELDPLIPGTQERGRRGGTENAAGIAAFGAAAAAAPARLDGWRRTALLRDRLETGVLARIAGTRALGAGAERLPNTSCLLLPAPLEGAVMVAALDLRGFAVSSGSACSSGTERASVVAEAMGLTKGEARRTVRVSIGPETTGDEIEAFVEALEDAAVRRKGGRA